MWGKTENRGQKEKRCRGAVCDPPALYHVIEVSSQESVDSRKKRIKTEVIMRDFTLTIYKKLLIELLKAGYGFVTFAEFIQEQEEKEKTVILRHDVDKKPSRSLRIAVLENELGIKGTYYFRVVKNELPRKMIGRMAKMRHEIGYHYNDLNDARGIEEKALESFKKNLAKLREVAPVKTACMHGSPLSRHDNRDLWKDFDYHDLGITGEPYFDIDFNEAMYLTDTGRRWDGEKVAVRDKVGGQRLEVRGKKEDKKGEGPWARGHGRGAMGEGPWARGNREEIRGEGQGAIGDREERKQKTENRGQKKKDSRGVICDPPALYIHSTYDILKALQEYRLPDKIMLTIHPQRWTDKWLPWVGELVGQKVKNVVKYFIARSNS